MYRYKAKNSGFSLIEVLVAIVILAIAVAPILMSLVLSSRANEKSDELLQTQLAVQSVVEQLMAEGYKGCTTDENGSYSNNFSDSIVSTNEDGTKATLALQKGSIRVAVAFESTDVVNLVDVIVTNGNIELKDGEFQITGDTVLVKTKVSSTETRVNGG